MRFQKGDYIIIVLNWTNRVLQDKPYKVIDTYPVWTMEHVGPSKMENYVFIEDEKKILCGYSEGKFILAPNNLKLKRLEKLKKINDEETNI